jgi:hypothetical protein
MTDDPVPTAPRPGQYGSGNQNRVGRNGSKPRITKNVERLLAVLIPQSAAQAARTANMPARTAQALLAKPHVQEAIRERLQAQMKTSSVVNGMAVYDSLMLNAESEHVRMDLAKDVLAQAGVRRTIDRADTRQGSASVTLNINLNGADTTAGVVVDHVVNANDIK